MATIYLNRLKYGGKDVTDENLIVNFKGEKRQLRSVLDELAVKYVEELPADVTDSVFGKEHTISVTKDYNTYADDIIGDYFTLVGSRYEVKEGVTVTHNGSSITYFIPGATSYKDNNNVEYDFLKKYDFTATYEEVHTDYYIGYKERSEYTMLATMDESRKEFVSVMEKGTSGGVATLDANGMLPITQMPVQTEIYIGEWDASTGEYPTETPERAGVYYNISVAGKIGDIDFKVNDKLIWDGTSWNKQSQTSDVASVDGRKGEVNLEDKYAQFATENTFTEVNTFEKGLVSSGEINLKNNNINEVSYVRTNNVQVANSQTLFLGDEDGANVVIGSNDEEYNTKTQLRGTTVQISAANPIEGITNTQERQFTGVDILSTIENSLPALANKNMTYFCRFNGTCSNTPYGSGDCDFHATIHKLGGDNNWIFVELMDVRSDWGYNWTITKINGTWKSWMRNANTGDIPTKTSQLTNDSQIITGFWTGSTLRLYVH